jgi:WASH complex subunit strumpellin
MDFLTEGSIAGQTLLRLVSRGSSIIAELQRLSSLTPTALRYAGLAEEDAAGAARVLEGDPRAARYRPVLFDFRYIKTPEMFDKQLNTSAALAELDEELFDAHEAVLARFYGLFESIVTYLGDYNKYLRELEEGYYIQHTLEAVLLDVDGRQLLCEGLYLYGVILLLLDQQIPGSVRERLIVAHYRHKGEGAAVTIVDLSRLCRDTGYRAPTTQGFGPQAVFTPAKRPANYPEEYLARFPVSPKVSGHWLVCVCVCAPPPLPPHALLLL